MIIDLHTHIVPPQVKQNREKYSRLDPGFAAMFSNPKVKLATADELIEDMDRDLIDVSVALNYGWRTTALHKQINDYLLESADRYPGRIVAFCMVDMTAGEKAAEEIKEYARRGARGIGEIRPDVWLNIPVWLDMVRPAVNAIIDHNLILLTHSSEPVGHIYPGKDNVTPDILCSLATTFPSLELVCAHWGGGLPFYALMPEVKKALRNVYFDTAASPFLYTPQVYRLVEELVGEDKILFGSDYPLLSPRRLIKEVENLELPPSTKENILSGNARRILGNF